MSNKNTYSGIYRIHKYWGKKPFNEVSKYIETYSSIDDVVMDCFSGSGVTLIEALKAGRKAIGVDLNPIAIKLSRVSVTPIEDDKVYNIFKNIKDKLQNKIYTLYKMDYGGEKTIITHTIWKNKKPIEVWYSTDKCKKKIRNGNSIDIKMCNEPEIEPKWYPKNIMLENSRINIKKEQRVSDLFTPRALVGLSLIYDEIKQIKDYKLKSLFEILFSGTLSQASNLVFVIKNKNKSEVGSWTVGYWAPKEHFEINVWNCFENRFKRVIKGQKEINELFFGKNIDKKLKLIHGTATNIPIKDNSVDYVFIDPPHINRILYLEQSFMWNSWLELNNVDLDNEMIISEAKSRKHKNLKNYIELFSKAILEIKRVLKPNKYISLAFNCSNKRIINDILGLFNSYSFEIVDNNLLKYSAPSVIQNTRKNSLKSDIVITFKNIK